MWRSLWEYLHMNGKRENGIQTMETLRRKFIANKKIDDEFLELLKTEKAKKLQLFWSIWYDTDFSQLDILEEKIFTYGDLLKENDYIERELFVYMYTVLRMLKIQKEKTHEVE